MADRCRDRGLPALVEAITERFADMQMDVEGAISTGPEYAVAAIGMCREAIEVAWSARCGGPPTDAAAIARARACDACRAFQAAIDALDPPEALK